jgi:hypothetical protein
MADGAQLSPGVADALISARLMILQSKRLMLSSLQRRLEGSGIDSLRKRVERLKAETERAQFRYRSTMLSIGSPRHDDYWPVAYSRMIEMGNTLSSRLREATRDLPAADRYEASTDVEALEHLVAGWRESMVASMRSAVA